MLARNEAINQRLNEHPKVLAGGALVFANIVLIIGVKALAIGKAHHKRGHKVEGPMAHLHGVIWVVVGLAAGAIGVYKVLS
jgi:hypothetical protein